MKNPFVCVPPIAAKPHTNERIFTSLALCPGLSNGDPCYMQKNFLSHRPDYAVW